jgi:hypothetical protein
VQLVDVLFIDLIHLPSIFKGDTNRFDSDTRLLIIGADDLSKARHECNGFSPLHISVKLYDSHLFLMFKRLCLILSSRYQNSRYKKSRPQSKVVIALVYNVGSMVSHF